MRGKSSRLWAVPILSGMLVLANCTDQRSPVEQLLAPDAASFAKGERGKSAEKKLEKGPKVRGKDKKGRSASWVLAVGKLPEDTDTNVKAWTDGKNDVVIGTAGHYLRVPAGAVKDSTLFKMRVYKKAYGSDSTVVVAVELRAVVLNADGTETDVGEKGFLKPVQLGITYGWADLTPEERNSLNLLWLRSDGTAEEVLSTKIVSNPFTADPNDGWVIGDLLHFSDYGIGVPRAEELL